MEYIPEIILSLIVLALVVAATRHNLTEYRQWKSRRPKKPLAR